MKNKENRFDPQCRRYMLLRIVYSMVSIVSSLFLNTFLLKAYGSFSPELIKYNIFMRAAQPVGVFCALLITSWLTPVITQILGLFLLMVSLVLLCVFGGAASGMYPLFAVLLGFADAFYYSVNCMQILSFTRDDNRDRFSGTLSVIAGVISIILPTLCGYTLQSFRGFTGYSIVFGFGAVCVGACMVLAARLPVKREKRRAAGIGKTMTRILRDKNCMRCIIANALSHCRSGTLSLFLTMLVYNQISNEMVIGLRSTLSSAAGLVSAAVYGILIRSKNRTKSSVIAICFVLVPCVFMLFGLNVTVLMVFSVVYAFAATFLSTPISFTYYKAVEALGMHGDTGAEVQLAADIFVAATGISGYLLIAAVPKTNGWAVAVIVSMVLLSAVITALIRRADKDLNIQNQR